MANSTQVLREYLVSLGYKVDKASEKTFGGDLKRTNALVHGLGRTVIGVGTAAQAMVTLFSRSMENLYYVTRKAESSAGNLKALDYAARSIGLTSEGMTGALTGMARAMRLNPGLQGLVESFGIRVTGRDKSDVAIDLLDTLRKMPFYIGSQYAGLFGIGPDEYLLLIEGLDKLKAVAEQRKAMAAAAGLDAEEAMKAGKEYAEQLREIKELLIILKDVASVALLPAMKEIAGVTKDVLKDWTEIIKRYSQPRSGGVKGFLKDLYDGARVTLGLGLDRDTVRGDSVRRVTGVVGQVPSAAPSGAKDGLLARLEKQYGIPAGLLDKVWAKESGRGKYMRSPAGAQGHFQFMPKTAAEYGVTDPDDLEQSATGAAKYLRRLMDKYGGSEQLALAAYNWGQGNLDKYGPGRAPKETRDYVKAITGQPLVVQSSTVVNVKTDEAAAAGKAVAGEQMSVNTHLGQVVRNNVGAVQ